MKPYARISIAFHGQFMECGLSVISNRGLNDIDSTAIYISNNDNARQIGNA